MRHQQALQLNEDQKAVIKGEMQRTMARFTDLRWQQSAEVETMTSLAKQQVVDEKKALAHFDKLLSIESEIKRLHFTMLVKVKNTLTPEQQAKSRELQQQERAAPPNVRGMPGADERSGAGRGPGGRGGERQEPPQGPPPRN